MNSVEPKPPSVGYLVGMVLVIAVTESVMFRLHRSVTWAYGFGSVAPVNFLAVWVYSCAWRRGGMR